MGRSVGRSRFASWSEYLAGDSLFSCAVRLQSLLRTLQRHAPKGGRLLEAGFGGGSAGVLLADLGYDVTLLDIEPGLFDLFRRRFPGYGADGRLRPVRADMFALPFPDGSFDVVYHQGVLEHLDDHEIVRALSEQARVGRKVIIDVPNSRYSDRPYGDERHVPVGTWRRLIRQAGLEIEDVSGRRFSLWAYALPYALFRPPLVDRLRLGQWAGTVSIFVCRAR